MAKWMDQQGFGKMILYFCCIYLLPHKQMRPTYIFPLTSKWNPHIPSPSQASEMHMYTVDVQDTPSRFWAVVIISFVLQLLGGSMDQ